MHVQCQWSNSYWTKFMGWVWFREEFFLNTFRGDVALWIPWFGTFTSRRNKLLLCYVTQIVAIYYNSWRKLMHGFSCFFSSHWIFSLKKYLYASAWIFIKHLWKHNQETDNTSCLSEREHGTCRIRNTFPQKKNQTCVVICFKNNEIHILKVLHSNSTYLATFLFSPKTTTCIILFVVSMMNYLKQATFGKNFILLWFWLEG